LGEFKRPEKITAFPAIVGGIGQLACPDSAEISALSGGWIKRLSGISGDQLTKLKNKAPKKSVTVKKFESFGKFT
jgi:hypothetical protein